MEMIKFDEMKKTWFEIAKNNDGICPLHLSWRFIENC